MTDLDLRSFANRYRALVDTSPPTTRRETRAWIVDPLLEALGWDVHADSCLTGRTVDGTRFEYVCTIDSIPALFVAVEPFSGSLEQDRASAIYRTMAWTGVDRAIYTNGRHVALLARSSDVGQSTYQLSAIDDHESSLTHYTTDRIGRRLERHSRDHVARQIAIDRSALVDSIVDELVAIGGSTYESEFESETDRFLERLVASFATDATTRPAADGSDADAGVSIQFTEPTPETDDATQSGTSPRDDSTEASQTDADAADRSGDTAATDAIEEDDAPSRSTAAADGDTAEGTEGDDVGSATDVSASADSADVGSAADSSDDGSADNDSADVGSDDEVSAEDGSGTDYVVRFFNERGSIGAIGHSTSDRALVHAAEYCFERGLSGVDVPWSPDDSDSTALNDQPVHADGSPMAAAQQLSNGLYLNTGGSVDDRAARVAALASRSGLRAMLTGDWEDDRN
ncbi:hypothetical protein [Halosolutus halophilus]|uniref:hypothetical protein n=1 Tax=Halosolutus halophilus TaxID=1552990 RepID=UPI0022352BBD|nr:hypothetical protein [Halosolutus halophilus]